MKYQLNEKNIITGIYFGEDPGILLETDINFGLDSLMDGKVVRANQAEIDAKTKAEKKAHEHFSHHLELKNELEKVKEDIEQVDLFGMARSDIEQKRIRAAEIVVELRELGRTIV